MIEVLDSDAARRAVAAGVLRCPCGGRLRAWGHARMRVIRDLHGSRRARPDRARCRTCQGTHVLLPADMIAGRAYTLPVIGSVLVEAVRGSGYRLLARRWDIPATTIRSWLRRGRGNAQAWRRLGVDTVVAVEPDLLPDRVQPNALGEALQALAAAALAVARRFLDGRTDLWPVIGVITRGRLLAPAEPASL